MREIAAEECARHICDLVTSKLAFATHKSGPASLNLRLRKSNFPFPSNVCLPEMRCFGDGEDRAAHGLLIAYILRVLEGNLHYLSARIDVGRSSVFCGQGFPDQPELLCCCFDSQSRDFCLGTCIGESSPTPLSDHWLKQSWGAIGVHTLVPFWPEGHWSSRRD
jgi:hypothetical protein